MFKLTGLKRRPKGICKDRIVGTRKGSRLVIYEPLLGDAAEFMGYKVVHSFAEFKRSCDVIVANRVSSELSEVMYKVYTRDIFGRD